MVIGIGTDILKIDRLACFDKGWDDPFFRKVFTQAEREAALERAEPLLYFATRFAGKEAVFKTLHIDPNHVRLDQIEILNGEFGEPKVVLLADVAIHARQMGIKNVMISLSYDTDYATAFAVANG